jgi:hypothetical protein
MKICPRCHRECLNEEDVMNSISHVGDNILICNECGKQQGFVGMNYSDDPVEIAMEERFRKELGSK